MNKVVYDRSFDWNEWFVLISLLCTVIIFILPKIFSRLESILYYLYGIFIATFFDHTISVAPWDFYDVNNSSAYEWFDFLDYVSFGTYSYVFMYLNVKLRIKGFSTIAYLCAWFSFSLFMEWIGTKLGVYHYNKGYKMYWSVPIYLFVQSAQIILYHIIQNKSKTSKKQY